MPIDKQMTIRLEPEIFHAFAGGAEDRSMSPPALATEILTNWVLGEGLLAKDDQDRLSAERELFQWVRNFVERHRKADDWDEDFTLYVFDTIKFHYSELYARAIKGGRKTQVNREIGTLVRRGLGAEVRDGVGGRLYGQPLRGQNSLIKTYTKLFRPSQK